MAIIQIEPRGFCADASDLRWAPNVWPTEFRSEGHLWKRVRIQIDPDGDVAYAKYVDTISGDVLTVWND